MAQIKTTFALSVLAHGLALASIGFVLPNGERFGEEALTHVELVTVESGAERTFAKAPVKRVEQERSERLETVKPQPKPVREDVEGSRKAAMPEPVPAQAQVAAQGTGLAEDAKADRKTETGPAVAEAVGQEYKSPSVRTTHAAALKEEHKARPAGIDPGTEAAFNSYVIQKIDRAKLYPNWARQRGYEGDVLVRFRLAADGSISELKVVGPCECDILNKAACEAIKRAAPFNDGPANVNGERVMEVNIGFRLKR